MSQTLTKIIIHIIFSTKKRAQLLTPKINFELYAFIAKSLQNRDCRVIKIGGAADHIHILCVMSKKYMADALVKEIKVSSSKWIKTKDIQLRDFYWQRGYGIFSVSPLHVGLITNYIENQNIHHKKFDFQEEFRLLLRKYNIEFDEKYVWD